MTFVRVPGNPTPDGALEHRIEGRGGVMLRLMTAPAIGRARGSVIVFPGRTEFIEKYFEVTAELQQRGFAVLVIDWRGQGLSDRLLPNPLKGHLDSFDDAAFDLAAALKMFEAHVPRPHLLLAHSMGGAIALRGLQTRRLTADGVLFSSPMWGLPDLTPLSKGFVRFAAAIGAGHAFAPGVATKWKPEKFNRNPVTQDRERHARNQGLVVEEPRLALAGPTLGWVAAALETFEGFRQPRALAHLRGPTAIVAAGRERLVDNAQTALVARLIANARVVVLEDARHEIMMELDPIRAKFWAAFDALATEAAA